MSALTFELKGRPDQRLDLSSLTPTRLAGMKQKEVAKLEIGTTKTKCLVGDAFKLTGGDVTSLRFVGTDDRCDRIGAGMSEGEIAVEGAVGAYLGASMRGGAIALKGNAGHFVGAGMAGGSIDVKGNVGERAGGVVFGEIFGMRGGRLSISGDTGPMLGERMRRGIVTVGGKAGDYAGARVVSGTIVFLGTAGRFAGYGSKRGSLIFLKKPREILPTFADCGVIEFTYLDLLERALRHHGVKMPRNRKARRLMGDMAAMGKGEMLILA